MRVKKGSFLWRTSYVLRQPFNNIHERMIIVSFSCYTNQIIWRVLLSSCLSVIGVYNFYSWSFITCHVQLLFQLLKACCWLILFHIYFDHFLVNSPVQANTHVNDHQDLKDVKLWQVLPPTLDPLKKGKKKKEEILRNFLL